VSAGWIPALDALKKYLEDRCATFDEPKGPDAR
jgi:hypothetical protein